MRGLLHQVLANLRANRLRTFLTMFGIAWGVVSVVVLSATGEGFRRGNEHVLQELGRNISIVWGQRTSTQPGGLRAGRAIHLTLDDARALERGSSMIAVVSPELTRGAVAVESAYNSASLGVHGVEPAYQDIRTIDIDRGRGLTERDEHTGRRVAVIGADVATQLFAARHPIGETIRLSGLPYIVVGTIRDKQQDSSYSGRDNELLFVPFTAMARDLPRLDAPPGSLSNIVLAPHPWVVAALPRVLDARQGRIEDVEWPLEREIRGVLAARHGFDPDDPDAIVTWDTSLESLMFGRMVAGMRRFFTVVGLVTLGLGALGVMNIMLVAVRERTREIGVRMAMGATRRDIEKQFFLEGFVLTVVSGSVGFGFAAAVCTALNQLPMPARFEGMILTPGAGMLAVAAIACAGVVASLYPARRAARLTPVEALRFEA
ncbi:MAG: ABC transporter permease [Vicinamibacterales bacterium]